LNCFFHALIAQSLEPGFTVILYLELALVGGAHIEVDVLFVSFRNKSFDGVLEFGALGCWFRLKSVDSSEHLLNVLVQRSGVFSHSDDSEKILIRQEVESREFASLSIKISEEILLD
jgi:hypothetical protein